MTSSTTNSSERIVWIDCEMTGLSLEHDALIEVAVLITDYELNQLDDGLDVIVRPPEAALTQMNDFVRDMHTSSGLLDVLADGMTLEQAEEAVLAHVRAYVPDAGKAPLGGNTVATDRAFLARDMPTLEGHLHYRMIDVSSIKELSRRWYPRAYFAAPTARGFERPYGWAWAMQPVKVCRGTRWERALAPLEAQLERNVASWLDTQQWPVRHGVHANSALALLLIHDASPNLRERVGRTARAWFGGDTAPQSRRGGAPAHVAIAVRR